MDRTNETLHHIPEKSSKVLTARKVFTKTFDSIRDVHKHFRETLKRQSTPSDVLRQMK